MKNYVRPEVSFLQICPKDVITLSVTGEGSIINSTGWDDGVIS